MAEKNELTFSTSLSNELIAMQDALPKGLNVGRFVNNAVALLNSNDTLAKFVKEHGTSQVRAGLLHAAVLGLDASNKEFYLIPYGAKLQFMIDYRGAKKLAFKYSTREILDITGDVVREGDEFSKEVVDNNTVVTFKPVPFSDRKIIGAFAMVTYKDGGCVCETMSLKELETTRSKSKASNSMAWKDFTSEMYKKVVLHRLCKHIPLNFESAEQRMLFDDDVAIDTGKKEAENPFADEIFVESEQVVE